MMDRLKRTLFLQIPDDLADEHRRLGVQLLFDYFKHLSSLTIASIGGVLILAGSVFEDVEDQSTIWKSVAFLAASVYINIIGQDEIVKAVLLGKSRIRRIRIILLAGMATFALGLAIFLGFALNRLGLSF